MVIKFFTLSLFNDPLFLCLFALIVEFQPVKHACKQRVILEIEENKIFTYAFLSGTSYLFNNESFLTLFHSLQ